MRYVVLLAVLLVASGCAGAPIDRRDGATHADMPDSRSSDSLALELVGLWQLSGTEEEVADTWVRVDAREMLVIRPCGQARASWRAGESRFVASVSGSSGRCASEGGVAEVPWLEAGTGFRLTTSGWELIDARGETVASFTVDGAPPASPELWDEYRRAPEVTEELRARLREPAPLPAEVVPADGDALMGRWVPKDYAGGLDPHVVLDDDQWSGSDCCNGGSGRWTVDEGGTLLATSGVSTLIWCEGSDVPFLIASASRAGVDGEDLVLFDADGTETSRLIRS